MRFLVFRPEASLKLAKNILVFQHLPLKLRICIYVNSHDYLKRSLEALIYSRSPINRYKDVYENLILY